MQAARRAAELICASDSVRAVSHYDADGLAAAGVAAETLRTMGKRFHLTIVHDLNDELVERLAKEKNDLTIFCDMGSGQLELIQKLGKIIICDHHKPEKMQQYLGDVIQINAHIFGIDGNYEASAATIAFVLAIAVSESNWDLCQVALAGAVGDRQGIHGLRGLNREIAEEGAKRGHISESTGLNISGAAEKKISEVIAESADPFFCGLSGELEKTREWLAGAKINGVPFAELPEAKRRTLVSLLAMRLIEQGARPEVAERLVGKRYLLKSTSVDCERMADLLNACGRSGKETLGVALCMNFPKYRKEAEALLDTYGKKVMELVLKMRSGAVREMNAIQYAEI